MLICNMNIFFYLPWLTFTVWTSIVSPCYDFIITATKNAFAFLALSWKVNRNAVANWAGNKLIFEKRFFANPFLIYRDKFGLKYSFRDRLLLNSLLHAILL